MYRILGLFTIVALLGLIPRSAEAQTVSSAYRHLEHRQSFTVFGGQFFTERGELGLVPRSMQAGGLRYFLRLGGPLSVVATGLYLAITRAVLDTDSVSTGF